MKPKQFRLLKDSTLSTAKAGDVVFDFLRCDYGLASDDTRYTGKAHRSVTLDPDGGYPSFTVPEEDLELVPEASQ